MNVVNDESKKVWDEAMAFDLPGKLLLVGLTFGGANGTPGRQEQFWGRVTTVDRNAGISLTLKGSRDGEVFTLPPDTRSLHAAAPGEYSLRSTAEVVVNPDYTVTFYIEEGNS
jgi:hypothetical protein